MYNRSMNTNTETLTGYTARPVTVSHADPRTKVVDHIETIPTGTMVYVRERRGHLVIRVPGTLLEQTVYPATVIPA